jgi:hypothetical protein
MNTNEIELAKYLKEIKHTEYLAKIDAVLAKAATQIARIKLIA